MSPQAPLEFSLGNTSTLRSAIENPQLHSMVFWGRPALAKQRWHAYWPNQCDAAVISLSAVLAGVKDIRKAVEDSQHSFASQSKRTVSFVDEVHRFNKAHQDAFLPHIEDGTFYFDGALAENPPFALNNALLSRLRVYVLKRLSADNIKEIIKRGLGGDARGLDNTTADDDIEVITALANAADGDARRSLILLELLHRVQRKTISHELIMKRQEDHLSEALDRCVAPPQVPGPLQHSA